MAANEVFPSYCADFIDDMELAFQNGNSIDLDSYTTYIMDNQGCTWGEAEEMVNDCASIARGRVGADGGGMKTKTRNLSKGRRKNTMKRKRNTKRRTRKLTKKRKLSKKRKKKTKRR
jgi:hypothetical protein